MAIMATILGCVAIAGGIFGKTFYSADVWGGSISDKPIPRWLGRTIALFVGIFMIVVGTASLINHQPSFHFMW